MTLAQPYSLPLYERCANRVDSFYWIDLRIDHSLTQHHSMAGRYAGEGSDSGPALESATTGRDRSKGQSERPKPDPLHSANVQQVAVNSLAHARAQRGPKRQPGSGQHDRGGHRDSLRSGVGLSSYARHNNPHHPA